MKNKTFLRLCWAMGIGCLWLACVHGAEPKTTIADKSEPIPLGLYAVKEVLCRNGRPYYGMGVNYLDAFDRTLFNPEDKSYREGFRELREKYQIPFIRFRLGGFWPKEWQETYMKDKEQYFRLLDEVVKEAEARNLGLIPSFFWHYPVIPDLVGESMDQYGNPYSKTNEFIRTFSQEVVTRYKDSPALWGWEFGNEYMLVADLPDKTMGIPGTHPKMGTASQRSDRDYIRRADIQQAYCEFSKAIRLIDPNRILISGDAAPRAQSYHMHTTRTWIRDRREEWAIILRADSPGWINTLSLHLYPEHRNSYFPERVSIYELIQFCQKVSKEALQPLYIGEFGAPETMGHDEARAFFTELVEAIVKNRVPLSAAWVYQYAPQEGEWNITSGNNRSYMLEMIQKANLRLNQTKSLFKKN